MARSLATSIWPLRAAWVAVALVAGGPAGDALTDRSGAVVAVVAVGCWAAWAGALVALGLPRTLSLTVVRTIVPASLPAAAIAVAEGGAVAAADVALLALAALATVLALAPWTTDAFVDGSSYGPERRIALRTPPAVLVAAVAAWIAVLAGAVTGPLLLAAEQWAAGAAALLLGWAVSALGTRSIHQLSRRWLVLVPTGMVIHDPMTMPEAQLFLRQTMRRLGPTEAPVGEPEGAAPVTEDLTAGASGLVVELVLDEPVDLLVRTTGRDTATRAVDRVLFTPSLPGRLLAEARRNRLPVG